MIITCNKCNAKFSLDEKLIKPKGSKVRCSKCMDVFIVYPPSPVDSPTQGDTPSSSASTSPAAPFSPDTSDQGDLFGSNEFWKDELPGSKSPVKEDFMGIGDMLKEEEKQTSQQPASDSDDFDLSVIDEVFKEGGTEEPDQDILGIEDMLKDDKSWGQKEDAELDEIDSDLRLVPEQSLEDDDDYEPKVEFNETDEFAKYGTLEFNVSDMYKTLGIEVDTKVDTEKELSELSPEIGEDADELDLSGIDEMLEMDEEHLGTGIEKPKSQETEDDINMDIDLSDLDSMILEDEKNGVDDIEPMEGALSDNAGLGDDEVNAKTEVFNIDDFDFKPESSEADVNAKTEIFNIEDIENLDFDPREKAKSDQSDIMNLEQEKMITVTGGETDFSLEPEEEKEEPKVDDGLGLDIDLDFDEEVKEEAVSKEDDEEMALDLGLEPEEEKEEAKVDDGLDLDLDLDFDEEVKEQAVSKEDDEEMALDLGLEPEEEKEEAKVDDDLDLDLDLDLEDNGHERTEPFDIDQDAGAKEEEFELNLDLDEPDMTQEDEIIIDPEDAKITSEPTFSEKSDEFPFNLKVDKVVGPDEKTEVFDLDLDMDDEEFSDSLTEGDDKEEVSFELDLDLEDVDKDKEKMADLNEIDLDFDKPESGDVAEAKPDESKVEPAFSKEEPEEEESFELDFDFEDSEPEKPVSEKVDDSKEEIELELDLEDPDASPELKMKEEEESFGLDFEEPEDTVLEERSEELEDDVSFELEMESEEVSDDMELEFDTATSGDMQLKQKSELSETDNFDSAGFDDQIETEKESDKAVREQKTEPKKDTSDSFDMGILTDDLDDGIYDDSDMGMEYEDDQDKRDFGKEKKKRVGTPVLALLVLVILGAIGYGASTFLDIKIPKPQAILSKIPFVNKYFPAGPTRPEEILALENTINSKFVQNSHAGLLFVVSGKVRNEYSKPRNFIKLRGKLFKKGRKLVQNRIVYCGNTLTDSELTNLGIKTIEKRLAKRTGKNRSNVNIPPGKELSYMIVFSNVPEDIDEFTIEVLGSKPSKG